MKPKADEKITMREIAQRIDAHLRRFENDPEINKPIRAGSELCPYYRAGCTYPNSGGYVSIMYVAYQGISAVKRDIAEEYLRRLDAGFVGKHYGIKK